MLAEKDSLVGCASAKRSDERVDAIGAVDVDLVLEKAYSVAGRIVDSDGRPIPGAEIIAHMENRARVTYAALAEVPQDSHLLLAFSNGSGEFRCANLPGSEFRLTIAAPDYAFLETGVLTAVPNTGALTLAKGADALCRVVKAGTEEGIAGIFVRATSRVFSENCQTQTTGIDGLARFTALADGEYTITTASQNYVVLGSEIDISIRSGGSVEMVSVPVAVGGTISGRVTDDTTGEPVSDAEIIMMPAIDSHLIKTHADGTYHHEGLKPGRYLVSFKNSGGYVTGASKGIESRFVSVRTGEETSGVDFVVSRGVALRGRVVDLAKSPLSDVRITARDAELGFAYRSSYTEFDGLFEITGVKRACQISISAKLLGFVQQPLKQIDIGQTGVSDLTITMETGGYVSGLITAQSGNPAAGVQVSAKAVCPEAPRFYRVVSGADGRYVFYGLPGSTYQINAEHATASNTSPAFVTVVPGQLGIGVNFSCISANTHGSLSISGQVTNKRGNGIAHAKVEAEYMSGREEPGGYNQTVTDSDGHFRIERLAHGDYTIQVASHTYPSSNTTKAAAGSDNVNISLEDFATLEGVVVDSITGSPVHDFQILSQTTRGSDGELASRFYDDDIGVAFSDSNGVFELKRCSPGDVMLGAVAPGYAPTSQAVLGLRGGENRRDVVIRLTPGAAIDGHVRDSSGKPIPGATIYVTDSESRPTGFSAHTNPYGAFHFDALPSGNAHLVVTYTNYIETDVTAVVQAGTTIPVDIILRKGSVIFGVVRRDGKPIGGVDVSIQGEDFEFQGDCPVLSREDGTYTIRNTPPGLYSVVSRAKVDTGIFGMEQTRVIDVPEDGSVALDIDLPNPTAIVEGTITSNGRPVADANVAVLPIETDSGSVISMNAETKTGPDGRYRLNNVIPGQIALVISIPGETNDIDEDHSTNEDTRVSMLSAPAERVTHHDFDIAGNGAIVGFVTNLSANERTPVIVLRGSATVVRNPNTGTIEDLQFSKDAAGSATVKAKGDFRISGLVPGLYTVIAVEIPDAPLESSPVRYAVARVTVPDKSQVHVNLRLP